MNQAARAFPRFNVQELLKHLPDMGEGLSIACVNLHLDASLERCDELLARLQSAETAVTRLRTQLAEGAEP